jgi:ABC-type nickel/cobalt efflux system permease component RcnA
VAEDNPAGQLARGELRTAEVKALDLSGISAMWAGIAAWAVAFFVLLIFRGELERTGHEWWLWVAVTGFGLGWIGLWYCRRRWAKIQRATAQESSEGSSSS